MKDSTIENQSDLAMLLALFDKTPPGGSPLINYIRIHKFCELTGWSRSWVDRRINGKEGLRWVEGREFFHLPNGRIVISIRGSIFLPPLQSAQ
ncbi:hypothetical protein [Endozoicomonas acroporae]|uniref:hypothetical protein n=1 Tax=Endozoicomonas acroporae TaxID=1701104 RepID=UPI000C785ABB|nr:hypothetical protein [Endozoicomonas acroporae]